MSHNFAPAFYLSNKYSSYVLGSCLCFISALALNRHIKLRPQLTLLNTKHTTRHTLTCVYGRLEGEVAALYVEGEVVNVHPAGADQHLVVLDFNIAVIVDGEVRTRRSFVLLCPAHRHTCEYSCI